VLQNGQQLLFSGSRRGKLGIPKKEKPMTVTHDATPQFGDYLKQLRQARQLSTRALGHKAGLSSGELSRLENGKRSPQPDTLTALAKALNVPVADMFAMAGYTIPYDLPSMAPYLQARYGHLPEETRNAINNYLEQLIEEHGLDPRGPQAFEDETSKSPER
jgi:transcriptional regulator with XRE-family HTH domain